MPPAVSSEFQDLRAAIEAQIELFGGMVPRGHAEPDIPAERSGREDSGASGESAASREPAASAQSVEPAARGANQPTASSAKKSSDESSERFSESSSEHSPESVPASTPDTTPESSPEPAASASGASTPYDRIANLIPEGSPLRSFKTLEEVSEWVANTVLIPLDETRTNPVFGVGNPEADLMVIGEAPGRNEDLQGEPFVGRAGKLLDDILAAIDFDRATNAYIANILKSRPPNNRNPEASEVIAHLPILHKQIALIRPKLILCVGKTAGMSLLNLDSSLGAMRGTFHDYHGLPVLVTYHPAALLRNPNWKRPTWEDVKLLRQRYEKLTSDSPASDG